MSSHSPLLIVKRIMIMILIFHYLKNWNSNCSDLPSPSLPLNPARLSYRPGEPTHSSSTYRAAPGECPTTTAYSSSRAPEQGLPTVYNRAPAALPPPNDNQGAPATFRPPPASLYSSLQVGKIKILILMQLLPQRKYPTEIIFTAPTKKDVCNSERGIKTEN